MQDALVRGPVTEEGDRHLVAPADARRQPRPGCERDASADDRVRTEHPAREVCDVHRAAPALAEAVLAAVDLGHHPADVAPLGDAMAVTAMGARHVVVVAERTTHPRGDRLFAGVKMKKSRHTTRL